MSQWPDVLTVISNRKSWRNSGAGRPDDARVPRTLSSDPQAHIDVALAALVIPEHLARNIKLEVPVPTILAAPGVLLLEIAYQVLSFPPLASWARSISVHRASAYRASRCCEGRPAVFS